MCPGCRALLDPEDARCPYCGWDVRVTEVRRSGGLVATAAAHFGGVSNLLLFANVLAAVLLVVVHVRADRLDPGGGKGAVSAAIEGVLNPGGGIVGAAGAVVPGLVLEGGEWWRLLTAAFLHFGLIHIGVNMMALRNLGGLVEEAYGGGKALALYLLAGAAGSAAGVGAYVLKPHIGLAAAPYCAAGASGAICGWAGLIAALGFRIGGAQGKALWTSMLKTVGFILVLGIVLEFTKSGFRLDNWGHGGGFLFGLAAGFLCSFGVRARSNPAAVRAWDAAAVVLSLATLAAFVPPFVELAKILR
jgi:rhomboid protease GluP